MSVELIAPSWTARTSYWHGLIRWYKTGPHVSIGCFGWIPGQARNDQFHKDRVPVRFETMNPQRACRWLLMTYIPRSNSLIPVFARVLASTCLTITALYRLY